MLIIIKYLLLTCICSYMFSMNTDLKINKNITYTYTGLYIASLCIYLLLHSWNVTIYWKVLPVIFQILVLLVIVFAYNKEPIKAQIFWMVIVFLGYVISMIIPINIIIVTYLNTCLLVTLLHRQKLKKETWLWLIIMCMVQYFFVMFDWILVLNVCLSVGILHYMDDMQHNVEKSVEAIQKNLIVSQYGEIKEMYMNMRGWRHDYHNHIQTMKAYIQMGQLKELEHYFNALEDNLDEVNQLVKTDNLMIDAILNGKVSIMKKNNIAVEVTAKLPEHICIADVDLCVIVGNLLDNAIESCLKIEEKKRYVRVYIAVIKEQFYLSVQNSAKEQLSVSDRNYLTNKRGEHGFGMKRVKALVDKYDGYLNLQNEPGIFASEVSIPMNN